MFIPNQSSKGLCLPNAWVLRLYYLNFTPDNCVRCEAAFVGHNSIFLQDIVRCLVIIVRLDQMLLSLMKYHLSYLKYYLAMPDDIWEMVWVGIDISRCMFWFLVRLVSSQDFTNCVHVQSVLYVHQNLCTALIPLCKNNLNLPISHTDHYYDLRK